MLLLVLLLLCGHGVCALLGLHGHAFSRSTGFQDVLDIFCSRKYVYLLRSPISIQFQRPRSFVYAAGVEEADRGGQHRENTSWKVARDRCGHKGDMPKISGARKESCCMSTGGFLCTPCVQS